MPIVDVWIKGLPWDGSVDSPLRPSTCLVVELTARIHSWSPRWVGAIVPSLVMLFEHIVLVSCILKLTIVFDSILIGCIG